MILIMIKKSLNGILEYESIYEYIFNILTQNVFFSKLIAYYPIGRLVFRMSCLMKKFSLSIGNWSQRAVEYSWLIKNLNFINKHSLVLDVGCSESLLSHELIGKGFRVVGIDIRDNPFKDKRVVFLKKNIINTMLPNNLFDAIIIVSTIEHIGLEAYGQNLKDTNGDIEALRELKRIVKPWGIIIITTPYVGNSELRINPFERKYNHQRLKELINEMQIIKECYYYPYRLRKRLFWVEVPKEKKSKLSFRQEPGLACLVLQKEGNE